jgi:hypothetical protein
VVAALEPPLMLAKKDRGQSFYSVAPPRAWPAAGFSGRPRPPATPRREIARPFRRAGDLERWIKGGRGSTAHPELHLNL